jgi:hypothetical protein
MAGRSFIYVVSLVSLLVTVIGRPGLNIFMTTTKNVTATLTTQSTRAQGILA